MNENDMQALINILSKMDKKDIKTGLNKASAFLNSKEKESIINKLNNYNNK